MLASKPEFRHYAYGHVITRGDRASTEFVKINPTPLPRKTKKYILLPLDPRYSMLESWIGIKK